MTRVEPDAQALWRRLVAEKHLLPNTYDRDLVDQLRLALGMPRKLDIGLGLACVPAQDLVRCLLEIAEPFAGMLGDLLRLYADVGARSADRENLRLRFDFGRGDPLDLLLSAFREQVEQVRRTVVARNARRWTSESLWDLLRLIPRLRSGETNDELFRAWQREYNERRWPDTVPRPAGTGVAIADEAIASCLAVVEQFMQDARSSASDRNALAPAIWGERPSDHRQRVVADQTDPSEATISTADLAQADSDGWPAYLLAALFEFADRVRDVAATDGEAAQRFAAPIAGAVGEHIRARPRITVQVDEDVVHLIDLLSLPVWGKRHELYSAWVLSPPSVSTASPYMSSTACWSSGFQAATLRPSRRQTDRLSCGPNCDLLTRNRSDMDGLALSSRTTDSVSRR
jgi:hypothetical protein